MGKNRPGMVKNKPGGKKIGGGKGGGKPMPKNGRSGGAIAKPAQRRPAKPTTLAAAVKGAGAPKATQRPMAPKPKTLHTLVLMQTSAAAGSRTWSDYPSLPAAMDAFIAGYEKELRKLNPGTAKLTYTVADLHTYVDSLFDVSMMVADPATKQYSPKGKGYLKQQLLEKLRAAA